MPSKLKLAKSPGRKPGTSEDTGGGGVKFRAKILGLSAVSEQNSAISFDERSDGAQDQRDATAQLQEELNRRQESYVRRERQYKVRISELEAQLSDSRARKSKEGSLDASMDQIRQMHRCIMESVDQVQERTSKILQEQEKDLLRAFRARLYSVQEELESEKNKTDDGASAWIEKSKQLETEVEWTKELADRLDRLNQSLTRENQRLKTQFTTQENDREFLVKQLVSVKKDNVRLRNEYDALERELQQLRDDAQQSQSGHLSGSLAGSTIAATLSASTSALPKMGLSSGTYRPSTAVSALGAAGAAATGLPDADNRYKEIIKRLKRLLEVERRNLTQVRASYKVELQSRTELEVVLKECIQDVRAEITHQQQSQQLPLMATPTATVHSSSGNSSSAARGASVSTLLQFAPHSEHSRLSSAERQRLVDKLLAKERLLQLLASKAFPLRRSSSPSDPLLRESKSSSDPDDSWVLLQTATTPSASQLKVVHENSA